MIYPATPPACYYSCVLDPRSQENALVLANNPGRVPFIVDPANACTTWLKCFLAKVPNASADDEKAECAHVVLLSQYSYNVGKMRGL